MTTLKSLRLQLAKKQKEADDCYEEGQAFAKQYCNDAYEKKEAERRRAADLAGHTEFLAKVSPILDKVMMLSNGRLTRGNDGNFHYVHDHKDMAIYKEKPERQDQMLLEQLKFMAQGNLAEKDFDHLGYMLLAIQDSIKKRYDLLDYQLRVKSETDKKWIEFSQKWDALRKETHAIEDEITKIEAQNEELKEKAGWNHKPVSDYPSDVVLPLGVEDDIFLSFDLAKDGILALLPKKEGDFPDGLYSFYRALMVKFLYGYPSASRKLLYLSRKTDDSMNNFLSRVEGELTKEAFYRGVTKVDSYSFEEDITEIFASLKQDIEERSALLDREGFKNIFVHNQKSKENRKPIVLVILNDYPGGYEKLFDLEYIYRNGAKTGFFFVSFQTRKDLRRNSYNDETVASPLDFAKNGPLLFEKEGFNVEGDCLPAISFSPKDLSTLLEPLKVAKKEVKSSLTYEDIGFGKEKAEAASDLISIPVGKINEKTYSIEFAVGGSEESKPIAYLLIGAPKMGKSSLVDAMIYNGAMKYSPDDLNFYLIDFKDGVSSAQYARESKMPHIKVLAESSKQEEAEIILRSLLDEQARRNDIFKQQGGCKNLADYNRSHSKHMPRIVVVIDEVQKLFKDDGTDFGRADRLAGYLEDIVRQGRSAGIHVVLASQDASRKMMMCVGKFVPGRFAFGAALEDAENIMSRDLARQVISECTKPGIALVSHDSGLTASRVCIAYHAGKESSYAESVRRKWKSYPIHVAVVGEDGPLYVEQEDAKRPLFQQEKNLIPLGESFFDHTITQLSFDNYHRSMLLLGENEHIESDILKTIIVGASRMGADIALIDESRDLDVSEPFLDREGVRVLGAGDYLEELSSAYAEFKQRSHNRRNHYKPYFLIIAGLGFIDDFLDNLPYQKQEQKPSSSSFGEDFGDLPPGFDMGLQSSFAFKDDFSSGSGSSSSREEAVYGKDTLFKMLSQMNKANDFYIILASDKMNALKSNATVLSEVDYRLIHAPYVDTMDLLLGAQYKKSLINSCNDNIVLLSTKGQSLMKIRYLHYGDRGMDFIDKHWRS